MEDDKGCAEARVRGARFQSTSSVWRTTGDGNPLRAVEGISIHVLRVEDDNQGFPVDFVDLYFNPRPPCGGRLRICTGYDLECRISIHVLRVEDDATNTAKAGLIIISIHVLRVEDDRLA